MPDNDSQDTQTPGEETKAKLRQIRFDYTRAQNIIAELETYYTKFDEIRAKLDDDKNGLEVNLEWSITKKVEIDALVASTQAKISELEIASTSITSLVAQVQKQADDFAPLAAKITDPTIGIEAMHTQATNLTSKITALLEAARVDGAAASVELSSIKTKSAAVQEAYDAFMVLKEEIDDAETGVQAQVEEIKQYAKDALRAKTSAESELASVISLKDTAGENLETIKTTKDEIDGYKDESEKLTNDIRNNLGLSSADSLSSAIKDQRKRLEHSVWLWGAGVAVAATLLVTTLAIIFYTLFLDSASKDLVKGDGIGLLLTVISKALFSSPLVFALYFATTNFSRTRDLRDRYRAKEIAAKNLQAYVKLLRDEFPNNSDDRLKFALHNMQAIYNDPMPGQRKRRYNIGINKIFQFDIQEDDVEQIKDKIIEGAEEVVEQKISASSK